MISASFKEKYIVIIASGGRTATTFFGNLLSEMINDAFSVHEPDILHRFNRTTWKRLKDFGLYNMVLGRLLGKTGIRNLSQNYQAGRLSVEELASEIVRHREKYYSGIEKPLIIESYSHWYGVLPALDRVFPNYKVAGIVRDPRTWVQSWINYRGLYDSADLVTRVLGQRLHPAMLGDTEFSGRWPEMSSFERLCWYWRNVAARLIKQAEQDTNTRIFLFEKLFSKESTEYFETMLEFITAFDNRMFQHHISPGMLKQVKNPSYNENLPDWSSWPATECLQLNEICEPYMSKLGYGRESLWKEKLSS